jgi:hypothetical protein
MDNTNTQAFQIEKLVTSFNCILRIIKETESIQKTAQVKLNRLKTAYMDLIKDNRKKVFLFCLDSFYFQYKSFQLEYDNLEKGLKFINNRMYCDYYKLFMIIMDSAKNKTIEIDSFEHREYTPYKDLEPFLEYQMNDIKDIHNDILNVIRILFQQFSNRHNSIENYNHEHNIGFSISNFINTLNYENRILNEQISLYMNYIAFFHISQRRHLKRMYMKFKSFYQEVDDNIRTNESFSIDDISVNQTINDDEESIGNNSEILANTDWAVVSNGDHEHNNIPNSIGNVFDPLDDNVSVNSDQSLKTASVKSLNIVDIPIRSHSSPVAERIDQFNKSAIVAPEPLIQDDASNNNQF